MESDSLLLILKVKDTEFTDYYPENVTKICYGEGNCHPWAYWYVYEGEVLEVIKGEFDEKMIKFAMLNHADYYKGIKKEWYVVLKEFNDQDAIEKFATKYFVESQSSKYSIKLK